MAVSRSRPELRILDVGLQRLTDIMLSLQKPKFRAKQIWEAALLQGKRDFNEVTTLALKDRAALGAMFVLRDAEVDAETISQDGTVKWLLQCRRLQTKATVPLDNEGASDDVAGAVPVKQQASSAGVLRMETVFIPEPATSTRAGRGTLCVSSQAGCSLACSFCHTGTQALHGNAASGDIVEQVLVAKERISELQATPQHKNMPHLTNIVFMGQGEPLLNWGNVKRAIGVLTSPVPSGLGLAPRRVTISTSGVAPVMHKVATETPGVRLALSLHAPTDELRSRIMGINKSWPLAEAMAGCRSYLHHRLSALTSASPSSVLEEQEEDEDGQDLTDEQWLRGTAISVATGQSRGGSRYNSGRRVRITFEYVMLAGVNDTYAHAAQLVQLLRRELSDPSATAARGVGIMVNPSPSTDPGQDQHKLSPTVHAHVNLIPFNPWPGSEYSCSSSAAIRTFQDVLLGAGISCTVRRSRGQDVMGACGQLRSSEDRKSGPARGSAAAQDSVD